MSERYMSAKQAAREVAAGAIRSVMWSGREWWEEVPDVTEDQLDEVERELARIATELDDCAL